MTEKVYLETFEECLEPDSLPLLPGHFVTTIFLFSSIG